jgi:predicted metal-dependent hydrolase
MSAHDIHDFVKSSQRWIEEEYTRIQKRATEDPGTAGDQGEENWAELLRGWLPSYFQIVTKGRILTESGYASPQVDVIVLMPSYPQILKGKKVYM